MKKIILISSLFITLSGCAHQIQRDAPVAKPASHVFQKTYTLGQAKTVSVGEALLQVKDYYVTKFGTSAVTPSEDFSVDGTLIHERFSVGQKLEVKGRVVIDNVEYSIAKFAGNDYAYKALLIKDDGTVHTKVGNYNPQVGGLIPMVYTYTITPATAKMERIEQEKVVTEKGYQNYELLYNGSDKNSMYFTYREFSPDGLARTPFYQNLTYEANSKTIRFKGFRINVLKSNGEEIKFIVVDDSIKS
jgi:hypothetical protein